MRPLEGDEAKLEPEETIAERLKLNPRKIKNEGTGLPPNKLLTRLPILFTGNNSCKLKN